MKHEIPSGLGRDKAGPLEWDDTALHAKRRYVAPRLVEFGPLKSLTLAQEDEGSGDFDSYHLS
jgi:hypothetical protein